MPIYEYQCADCAVSFEALVRNGDDAECPHCRGHKLSRQMSTFASRSGNGDAVAAASEAISGNGLGGRSSSGGCCGGACGCH